MKIVRMKELIRIINEADIAYFRDDNPIMSDKEYDRHINELTILENETGVVLCDSPLHRVPGQLLEGFAKVQHSKPMLSANKTKSIDEIKKFVGNKAAYCSYKLDGATLCVRYADGELIQAITRGNGLIGEDVTEQAKTINNLPLKIPYKGDLEVRGECVISWENFNKINETLDIPYSHPRNLAAGSLRNLDTNITRDRNLSYVVFECVTDLNDVDGLTGSKEVELRWIERLGFETVEREVVSLTFSNDYDINCSKKIDCVLNKMIAENSQYPVDGLIFEYDDKDYSKSLPSTGHHEGCRMALKWSDETYETILKDIEWNTTRSGAINPVAIFEPVSLDGAMTTRATLHNLSYIEDLQLGIGDTIEVYRANAVIPKVHDNLTRSDTYQIPVTCPCCGKSVEIKESNKTKVLYCPNENCSAKLLSKLVHFVSRDGMNINGLSEATLEKFVNKGWIKDFYDIYQLRNHADEIAKMNGFGEKSAQKILNAIENSKEVDLSHFICALGIPHIGLGQAKELSKIFGTWIAFIDAVNENIRFAVFDGFGDAIDTAIEEWWVNSYKKECIAELAEIILFKERELIEHLGVDRFKNKIFVVTGNVIEFKNRNEIKQYIEDRGGKVTGSVSAKTDYLICNDSNSASSKAKQAKSLGVKIINEKELKALAIDSE